MRVLIAGQSQTDIGGVQRYERELASWLLERGHLPIVYATDRGEAARELQRRTIPVTDDLNSITAPVDIIHGDGRLETMAALLHFPHVPAVFVAHGWRTVPPRFPRIGRYVAVDDTCADNLMTQHGIAPERISVLLNAVDIDLFRQREPLPPHPRRAVAFGNLAHELTFLPAIREACRQSSIELDVISAMANTSVAEPEEVLGRYDLAFAKAKCAMEAMSCGLAVILCSHAGLSGMVRSEDFDRLRRLNFGMRALQKPVTVENVLAELARYDPLDARAVSERIRATASSDSMHAALFAIYEEVIAEQAAAPADPLAEGRAAAALLHEIAAAQWRTEVHLGTLAKASQRVIQMPLVGPVTARALRWLTRRK